MKSIYHHSLACVGALLLLASVLACSQADPMDNCATGACPTEDAGAAGGPPACVCVPAPPDGWSAPLVLWTGDIEDAPSCPAIFPVLGFEAGTDLDAPPLACPACECEPPDTTCELPSSWTAGDGACGSSGVFFTLDPPESWDGSCLSMGVIPSTVPCGDHYCVEKVDVDRPAAKTTGCSPVPVDAPVPPEATFSTYVRACISTLRTACPSEEETCVEPAPDEFIECIFKVGENECPATWPEQHVVFEAIEDDRGCNPCACGDVEGASCAVQASVFSDVACSQVVFSAVVSTQLSEGLCSPVAPGAALGSMSASVVSLEPGSCSASGGELVGEAKASKPATFCCRP